MCFLLYDNQERLTSFMCINQFNCSYLAKYLVRFQGNLFIASESIYQHSLAKENIGYLHLLFNMWQVQSKMCHLTSFSGSIKSLREVHPLPWSMLRKRKSSVNQSFYLKTLKLFSFYSTITTKIVFTQNSWSIFISSDLYFG